MVQNSAMYRNKILQSSKLCLNETVQHVRRLIEEISLIKDSWSNLILEAKSVASSLNLTTEFKKTSRVRRKHIFMMRFQMNSLFKMLKLNLKLKFF